MAGASGLLGSGRSECHFTPAAASQWETGAESAQGPRRAGCLCTMRPFCPHNLRTGEKSQDVTPLPTLCQTHSCSTLTHGIHTHPCTHTCHHCRLRPHTQAYASHMPPHTCPHTHTHAHMLRDSHMPTRTFP